MFREISAIMLAAAVAAVVLHFTLFNWRRPKPALGPATMRRFSLWERGAHLLLIASLFTVALTGFIPVLGWDGPLSGWWRLAHVAAGLLLGLAFMPMITLWAADSRFEPYDMGWFMRMGGYLGGKNEPPAGRFNAGQKVFFWMAALLGLAVLATGFVRMYPLFDAGIQDMVLYVHRYCALLFGAMIIVHVYLGTIASPGTLRSMLLGKVSPEWAKQHHPIWFERAQIAPPTEMEPSPASIGDPHS